MGDPQRAQKLYQVKHRSGRVLGPIDQDRIVKLLKKKQLSGDESAREHPGGVWSPLVTHPGFAELILKVFADESAPKTAIKNEPPAFNHSPPDALPPTVVFDEPTKLELKGTGVLPEPLAPTIPLKPEEDPVLQPGLGDTPKVELKVASEQSAQVEEAPVSLEPEKLEVLPDYNQEKTVIADTDFTEAHVTQTEIKLPDNDVSQANVKPDHLDLSPTHADRPLAFLKNLSENSTQQNPAVISHANERTITMERPKRSLKNVKKKIVAVLLCTMLGLYLGLEDDGGRPKKNALVSTTESLKKLRPRFPASISDKPDPVVSQKIYLQGLREYIKDNVRGYLKAEELFYRAASVDRDNMKAVAMLASTYLNLVDTTLKDENYFAVILKLIEVAKARAPELAEVLIAETEFFLVANQPEAALNLLEQYTKKSPKFDPILFFYAATCAYQKGNMKLALKFINLLPEAQISSARVYTLRGDIARNLGDMASSRVEYEKAIQYDANHNLSRLRLTALIYQQGQLKESKKIVFELASKLESLRPRERAEGSYYLGQYFFLHEKWNNALQSFENAVKYDPQNLSYLLDLYTLKSRIGEADAGERANVKMYLYLSEGARAQRAGNVQGAILNLLKAKDANSGSVLPYLRLGELFVKEENWIEAKINFKQAYLRAPDNPEILSKYILSLLKNFEWVEAQAVMAKVRGQKWSGSALDKLAGDLYLAQGRLKEAEAFYKKAMLRETIDSEVYLSYAKLLNSVGQFKTAPLYFALAYRLDPLNFETLLGTAQAIAGEDSVAAAIAHLQRALQQDAFPRAMIYVALADFEIERGEVLAAKKYLDQAMEADPEYAKSWKTLAKIHLFNESTDKKALDKALAAYRAYSTRNRSDPSGYMERFKIFLKQNRFDEAKDELDLVFTIYPKYPNLHYFKGVLYDYMGNYRVAVSEYVSELKNNPNAIPSLIGAGKAFNALKDSKNALPLLIKAMALAPQSPEAKLQAAIANRHLKNYVGAIALFKGAIALDPGNPIHYKELGICFKLSGDPARAKEAFKKYLQMEPDAADRNEVQAMM